MTDCSNYRRPTKLKKFGITDPFLMLLATKYERELPWQTVVYNNETLSRHVTETMLPALLSKVDYPPTDRQKSFYVSKWHVNLDAALHYDAEFNQGRMDRIRETFDQQGESAATELLVEVVNRRKSVSFNSWTELLGKQYKRNPAFQLLLLRPILDLAGRGSRRELIRPVKDVIEWLHRRIERGRLLPGENLARLYCLKVGSGVVKMPDNGWRQVPADRKYAGRLAALCRGSGWCVAGEGWAREYLTHSHFHILYAHGQPVVALRQQEGSSRIVECRGRSNSCPVEWFMDIQLYLETRELSLHFHKKDMEVVIGEAGDIEKMPLEWWQERARLWPFGIFFAPSVIRERLMPAVKSSIVYYSGLHDFELLKDLLDLPTDMNINREYWVNLVRTDPTLFSHCPQSEKNTPEIREACIRGWVENLEDFRVSSDELSSIPDFVHATPEFLHTLQHHFPAALREKIRQNRGTRAERDNPFWLDTMLRPSPDEPPGVAVERMVNTLLNNETGIFADRIFPEMIRQRTDFNTLRQQAWKSAIEASPPLWFGLPEDLKKKKEFKPVTGKPDRVNLKSWYEKVEKKPWLLTQKNGVPKSIRHHKKILETYRSSWEEELVDAPWQIWFQYRPSTRRMYMSYGLLADEHVIQTMARAWQKRRGNGDWLYWSWCRASRRMRLLPSFQLAILTAIAATPEQPLSEGDHKVCEDIRENRWQLDEEMTLMEEEVEAMLLNIPFRSLTEL